MPTDTPMRARMIASRWASGFVVPWDCTYATTPTAMPATSRAAPSRARTLSRATVPPRTFMAATSALKAASRSPVPSTTASTATTEVHLRERSFELGGRTGRHDPPSQHDRAPVGDPQGDPGELLHDHDRNSPGGDRRHLLVQPGDDRGGEPPRQLAEQQP